MEIADLRARFMQQRDVTENAAHPPHILIFQITAVTPAQHHHREAVFLRRVKMRSGQIQTANDCPVRNRPSARCHHKWKRRVNTIKNNSRLAFL